MTNEERFSELLAAYLNDDLSQEDTVELHGAVNESKKFRERFQHETRLNLLLRETLVERVALQSLSHSVTPPTRFWSRRRLSLATTAALLMIVGTVGYSLFPARVDAPQSIGRCMSVSGSSGLLVHRGKHHHQAATEEKFFAGDRITCEPQTQAMLRLVDGSIVSMEPGAQLVLNSDRPTVTLEKGVAFFEIAPRRPGMLAFEVLTGNSIVAVMGTVFSVAAKTHTELKVYEGSVTFTRNSDQAVVEVASQQMATTERLAVEELMLPSTRFMTLVPTDDLTLNRGVPVTKDKWLKVDTPHRIAYLRFEIPKTEKIRSARLRIRQDVDSGKGTLRFFLGDHSDWTEATLTGENSPKRRQQIGQHTGVVGRRQWVEVDVSDAVHVVGAITVVMTLDASGENDIWFAPRESDSPPELILKLDP